MLLLFLNFWCNQLDCKFLDHWNRMIPTIMDWMFASPPRIHMLRSEPQCDGFRSWCLWRVFRSWGRSLHDGTSAFLKETLEDSLSLLLTSYTARWPSVNQVLGLCWPGSCWSFELGLPVSRTMRNEFLLFLSHPVMVLCYSSPSKLRHLLYVFLGCST